VDCQIDKLNEAEKARLNIAYGCDELGRLKSVLVHTPGDELTLINESNYKHWLYDKVPNISGYVEEHRSYQRLLESNGIRVYELGDYGLCRNPLSSDFTQKFIKTRL
jgi:arginine deiminase